MPTFVDVFSISYRIFSTKDFGFTIKVSVHVDIRITSNMYASSRVIDMFVCLCMYDQL